jgi:hypothetical protein
MMNDDPPGKRPPAPVQIVDCTATTERRLDYPGSRLDLEHMRIADCVMRHSSGVCGFCGLEAPHEHGER